MDKQAILYWGVGSAVAVYLIVKIWQLVRRWSLARAARAQREARHAQLQVVHAPAAADEPSVPRRHSRAVWPQERRAEDRVNPFEELGQEYPYADDRDYTFGGVTPAMAALVPASEQSRRDMSRTLKNAGYYSVHAWRNYQAVRYLGIVLPLMFFGALLIVAPERLEPVLMLGLLLGPMLGWALPAIVVRGRATERLHEMEIAMPDMLDLLNMCVSQGMTVPGALNRVSHEIRDVYPALSKELRIVTEQARVGTLAQSLNNFSERVDVPEVHSFSALLIQTEQMGTSVSAALEDYSDGMREAMRQRTDEKANSATFKLLFPTVLCLMPAVMLFLMGPSVIELNRFFMSGGMAGVRAAANAPFEQPQP